MLTLTDFLLARIAEDEADRVTRFRAGHLPTPRELREADRWEAEAEAKRRIVELQAENDDDRYLPGFHYKAQMIERVLRALALAYAGHPDYRDEWRP